MTSWSLGAEQDTAEREVLDRLDFRPALPCEVRSGCVRIAAWSERCLYCGAGVLTCQPHHVAHLEAFALPRAIVFCPRCLQHVPGSLWRLLVEFIPVGRP